MDWTDWPPVLASMVYHLKMQWSLLHDDIIKWKHFPHYWPFVWGIHRSPVNSLHKGQWRGALMFSLICAWTNGWLNNRETGDLRRHHPGLGSNTYLYLQIQIQIQIRRICICICIWSNFKPCICICICIWSTVFGVFDKYVFKYTFSWAVFYKHKFMENKLTWIFFINMLKSAILFQNKCRGLIVLIPIGGCVCALDLACQWVCDKPLA